MEIVWNMISWIISCVNWREWKCEILNIRECESVLENSKLKLKPFRRDTNSVCLNKKHSFVLLEWECER